MRPRHKTAENGGRLGAQATRFIRFNEAAAQNRGKHYEDGNEGPHGPIASMRPRHKTAEN